MIATALEQELDRGAARIAPGTRRTCALRRAEMPVDDMIRFVVGPGGDAVPDVKRKLPGRGIWITASRDALEQAIRRNVFARGFRRDVHVPADLAAVTDRMLESALLDALAVAGKAGAVVAGFSKVEAAIRREDAVAVLHAADGAEDGKRKIDGALRRNTASGAGEIPIIDAFSSTQLDLALNRINVVHAALLSGPASKTFLARAKRLTRYRSGVSDEANHRAGQNEGAED